MSGKKKKPPKGENVYCQICNVHIPIGCEQSHKLGKKHRFLEDIQQQRVTKANRSVHVGRLPPNVSEFELNDYFSRFGRVSSVHIPKAQSYCFVEFSCNVEELDVFNKRHVLRGRELTVRKAFPSNKKENKPLKTENDITKCNSVIEAINPVGSIEVQIGEFLNVIRLSQEEHFEREEFVAYLTQSVQNYFPGSRFEIFGSTANGLGFTGCDIDLTFFLPMERDERQLLSLDNSQVPSLKDVEYGNFPRESLMFLCKENLLRFLMKHIKNLPGITMVQLIPSARCPIIKFVHKNPFIGGDISFGKSLGLANTKLLRLYGRLDYNVYAMLVILRFWGKREGLVGSSHMITSYAFSWLVIFYLQHKELLPTIEELASLSEYKTEAENWDCTFTENFDVIPVGTRKMSFSELIKGFFEFYATFDFTVNVICPRDGSLVPKSALSSIGDDLDFKITSMSVQDVFDLTHNITASVSDKILQSFLTKCQAQSTVWQTMVAEGRIDLRNLFHQPSVEPVAPPPAPTVNLSECTFFVNFPNTNSFSAEEVCNITIDVLKRAFLFKCFIRNVSHDLVADNASVCVRKNEDRAVKKLKTSDTEEFLLHVSCEAFYRTWQGRKTVKGFVSTTEAVKQLDIEETIAKELVQKELCNNKKQQVLHEFEVALFLCQNTRQLKITITSKSSKKELHFTVFPLVKKYISTLLDLHFKR